METKKQNILEFAEKRANQLMYNNYIQYFYKKYEIQLIENVMCNDACHFVTIFKDYLIADDHSEYLRRIYKKAESTQRLEKLFSYYQETSVIFPNYTPLVESKYLYNNVIRKQRVIDEQQNLEEYKKYLINKEKKKNQKNSPLKVIENFFEQDTNEEEVSKVFNSKAYDEILNAQGSVKRIIFGIDNNENNIKNEQKNKDKEKDSVKDLIIKLNKYDNSWKSGNFRNDSDFINKIKKNLKNTAKLLAKNKNNKNINENKIKSTSKDKNNEKKKRGSKERSPSYKKNRTININININNTKNDITMTNKQFMTNNSHSINTNFPLTSRNIIKEKRVIFNQKKMQSTIPYQLFRCSNFISNLNKKSKNKNNNTNNNSINGLQQKLIEIFNKKIQKNKNNRNNSYNLSLSKNSNTSRLRTKNRAFIISTIQNTILHSKSKRNHSINMKSDKHIHVNNNKNEKNSSENDYYKGHKRIKSQTNNIGVDNLYSQTKKNLNTYYSNNNQPILTISPSLKKRNVFGFKTMSKLTETSHKQKSKKIYYRNSVYNSNCSHNSKNNSLKHKSVQNSISKGNNAIFPYKNNINIKKIYSNNYCF